MTSKRTRFFIYYPIILAVVLAAGVHLGSRLPFGSQVVSTKAPVNSTKKIGNLLNYIEEEYVDSVNLDGLTESAIINMLSELDPHSSYIPARNFDAANETLHGNFDGIGVEFNIIRDTIVVVAPISGGPSERLGIRSGDRIVMVEDSLVAGTGITNRDVIDLLRGPRGSMVTVDIYRRGSSGLLEFRIERDKIPIYSVDTSYMIDERTGYVKVSRFGATTYDEFMERLRDLKSRGMKQLILDLRGNPGGYLTAAIEICDELLETDKLIVYTEGRARARSSSYATGGGEFEHGSLAILIDEGSASASEIVAGAVQDNDRGVILGRRSFGKGLVQEQAELPDGSAVRLTIARYYTPTGRCIQRPYDSDEDYFADIIDRYEHGELYEEDSISVNEELKFTTPAGKTVYGGGGITPDIFIPLDTTAFSQYHGQLISSGVLREFALELVSRHQSDLQKHNTVEDFRSDFQLSKAEFEELVELALARGVKAEPADISSSAPAIKRSLRAFMARSKWNGDGYYPIMNEHDSVIRKALEALSEYQTSL